MKQYALSLLPVLLILGMLAGSTGCGQQSALKDFAAEVPDDSLREEILLQTAAYVLKPPAKVKGLSRLDSTHRAYYREQVASLQPIAYAEDNTGRQYLLLYRPARNVHGHRRGVAVSYRIDPDSRKLTGFRELFNTPMQPDREIEAHGRELLTWYLAHGHVDKYIGQAEMLDFPSSDFYYDTLQYEWLYRKEH